jgi:ubiquinone/menaquinone biosynthesis C-methylase UbiE
MTPSPHDYLLAGSANELERLRLQARVWEPEAEAMLDQIGIQAGWNCIDLGCGAMGILNPLSQRVGASGRVIGVDNDHMQLAAARAYVQDLGRNNIEIVEQNAYHTNFPRGMFDFVHVRFVLAPVGREEELLREMIALTRPSGIIAIEEPDATCWNCFPHHQAWDLLKQTIMTAFEQGGGDFNAGQRTYAILRKVGLEDVRVRAAVIALQHQHPYMRQPIHFATSLRQRILRSALLTEAELDASIAACEQIASDPETSVLTPIVTQVWGRKPL